MGPIPRRLATLATLATAVAALAAVGVPATAAPPFEPEDGRYRGEYTSGNHGPGKVRLQVEQLREGLHGVRLLKWSGRLNCSGGGSATVNPEMTAARNGRTFSGFVEIVEEPTAKHSFTGRFTATDALKATVRVRSGKGQDRCDTGPITFEAERVGP